MTRYYFKPCFVSTEVFYPVAAFQKIMNGNCIKHNMIEYNTSWHNYNQDSIEKQQNKHKTFKNEGEVNLETK